MDDSARSEVDYAQVELLLQQHKYDEALPILSGLVENDPSDRQARLCRLLVMRILILRHLLAAKTIPPPRPSTAIALRAPTWLALRAPSGFELLARLRDSVCSLPVRLDQYRLAVTARLPIQLLWSRNLRYWSRLQLMARLRNSMGVFLARHDRHRVAVAAAVPLALVALISVYVLVVWPVENRARLPVNSVARDFASPTTFAVATLEPRGGNYGGLWLAARTNLALDQSSFHRTLTTSYDLNWPFLDLGNDALSSAAQRQADEKQETRLRKVNDNHAVAKVVKRPTTSVVKPSTDKHEDRVIDAPRTILARYHTTQLIPLRKAARFAAATIQKIAKGTSVNVIGINNSWAKVTVKTDANENVIGFVRMEFLIAEAIGSL